MDADYMSIYKTNNGTEELTKRTKRIPFADFVKEVKAYTKT